MILDCDGTLLDSMNIWRDVEADLAQRVGIELTREQTDRIATLTLPEVADYFNGTFGLGRSPADVLRMIDETMQRFYSTEVMPRPGAVEFVSALVENGVKCAVASSTPHDYLVAGLTRCGLCDCMEAVLSVDDVGASKRERVIYDAARDAMGTQLSHTWGMDDSLYAIEALNRAGYATIAIFDDDKAGTMEQLSAAAGIAVRTFGELDMTRILAH